MLEQQFNCRPNVSGQTFKCALILFWFGGVCSAGINDMCGHGNPPGFSVAIYDTDGLRLAVLEPERGLILKDINTRLSYYFAVY
jgi:hypothetical protein